MRTTRREEPRGGIFAVESAFALESARIFIVIVVLCIVQSGRVKLLQTCSPCPPVTKLIEEKNQNAKLKGRRFLWMRRGTPDTSQRT